MCPAVPARVLSLLGDDPITRTGWVDFGGVVKEVNFAFAPEAAIGDYVLVHVGFAIAVLDQTEAEQVLAQLGEIEDFSDEDA